MSLHELPARARSRSIVHPTLLVLALISACAGEVRPAQHEVESADTDDTDAAAPSVRERDAAIGHETDEEPDAALVDARAFDANVEDAGDAVVVDATPDARVDAAAPTACAEPPLARGLKLRELALYQAVKIPLYRAGAWMAPHDLPIVVGKKALLRAFVDLAPSYTPHEVRAVLELQNAQGERRHQDEKTLTQSSSDAEPSSTFEFLIDGEDVDTDTQLSVTLHETECGALAGNASDVRLPVQGSRALDATVVGRLKVVVIPIEVGGRAPKTDAAEQSRIRDTLLAHFPVADVELAVRARALKWSGSVPGGDSNAWMNVLNQLMRERAADGVEDDVYYYGLMQPTTSFAAYCGQGCTNGMAMETKQVSPSEQAGLSVYFLERPEVADESLKTIVHELGHNHGRSHAPCVKVGSIRAVDRNFPDRNGATGGWGWDSRSDTLIPPTHKDVMGYCMPAWISPYTYAALAERSLRVNALPLVHQGPALGSWQRILLYEDGTARWGGGAVSQLPGGDVEMASALDASGRVLERPSVVRTSISHTSATVLYVPDTPALWSALVLSDRTLERRAIQPPL